MALGVEVSAMRGEPHMVQKFKARQDSIRTLSEQVDKHRSKQAEIQALLESLQGYAHELEAGKRPPPRAHIHRARRPASSHNLRTSRLAELWAAGSIGLMLLALVLLLLFRQQFLLYGLVAMLALFLFLEAAFRGRLVRLVTAVTLGLAMVAALILLYEFFWQVLIALVLAIGIYVLWDNLREFRL
jgi:hypothetical protein